MAQNKIIIFNLNQSIKTLFKIFGVEELNGLSQFYVDMESLVYIIKLIQYLFHPPKRDLRENPINYDSTNQVDNGGDEEDFGYILTDDIIPGVVE